MTYFEQKKKNNLVFTTHNVDPSQPYKATDERGCPIEHPGAISWWDRKKGRYRTAEEQKAYVAEVVATNARVEEHRV